MLDNLSIVITSSLLLLLLWRVGKIRGEQGRKRRLNAPSHPGLAPTEPERPDGAAGRTAASGSGSRP